MNFRVSTRSESKICHKSSNIPFSDGSNVQRDFELALNLLLFGDVLGSLNNFSCNNKN